MTYSFSCLVFIEWLINRIQIKWGLSFLCGVRNINHKWNTSNCFGKRTIPFICLIWFWSVCNVKRALMLNGASFSFSIKHMWEGPTPQLLVTWISAYVEVVNLGTGRIHSCIFKCLWIFLCHNLTLITKTTEIKKHRHHH